MSPWFGTNPSLFDDVEATLKARYPTLHAFIENGACRIRGTLPIRDGDRELDRYQIEVALPDDYPHSMPRVWETAGRIPRDPDRHTFVDGALCLGTPIALWIDLQGNFSIDRVLDIPIRGFLIGNSLVEQGQPWPQEWSHGAVGLLDHLRELLGIKRQVMAASFLLALATGKVTKHSPCPCQSGKRLFKCHREGFRALKHVPAPILDQTARLILAEVDPSLLAGSQNPTSPLRRGLALQ